jgi:hypothetical protein
MNSQRDPSGILFKNDKKTSERHPRLQRKRTVQGKEFWLSAWIKTGQNGPKFMSIALTAKSDQRQGSSARATQNDDDIKF